MGYKEAVAGKINEWEQRAAERQGLWRSMEDSFEKEGGEGIANKLRRQMADVERKFDAGLANLEGML